MDDNIKIQFSDLCEIRMGAPYQMGYLHLEGIEIDLPDAAWQDKYAISEDGKIIILIGFEIKDNNPGFALYIIDAEKCTFKKTDKIFGLVNHIRIENRTVKYNKFILDRAKSEYNNLCCNIEEELKIE